MQTAEERWNSAGIGNAFIFGKVMSANPDLLLELLQILDPRQEEYLKSSYDASILLTATALILKLYLPLNLTIIAL